MTKIVSIISILFLFDSCRQIDKTVNNNLQFIYTIDNDGLYFYDLQNDSTKKIYSTDKVFLSDKVAFLNDTVLIVGHQNPVRHEKQERKVYSKYLYRADGDSTFITDNPPYITIDEHDFVTEQYFAINISNGHFYKCKTIDFEHIEHSTLKICTKEFSMNGNVLHKTDTTFLCGGTSHSSKGIRFCNDEGRFYSKSETVNNKQIISKEGNLYQQEGNTEKMILKFDGHFEPKFGSGYFSPTLSPNGKNVTYQYIAGFLKNGSAIFEMNLETNSKTELIGEGYFDPKYSPDGQKLLVAKNQHQSINNTWINDIYILDIKTKKLKQIGQAENYLWLPKKYGS